MSDTAPDGRPSGCPTGAARVCRPSRWGLSVALPRLSDKLEQVQKAQS